MTVGMLDGRGQISLVRADPGSTRGWRSRHYGQKEPAISVMLETRQPKATFWTFFGIEEDKIDLSGGILRVNSREFDLGETS